MKFISEEIGQSNLKIISESDGPNGRQNMYITGCYAEAERKNRNKRIYPKSILEKAVAQYVRDFIVKKLAGGELNHPENPTVNWERACILIENLQFDGNQVFGKSKVLSTSMGVLISQLVNDGVQLGISSRGLGDVEWSKYQDAYIIQDNYTIQAFDIVGNPSGIDCWVNGIYESVDFYLENGVLKTKQAEKIHENIKKGNKKEMEKDIKNFFKKLKI